MLKLVNMGITIDPPSGPFPFGALINSNPLGSGTGTPAVAEWANEPIQAIYAVLDHFGISANDIAEQVGNSDLVRAFQSVFPVGSFLPAAFATDPATLNIRALPCEGQEVSEATYADLFARIGTAYNTGGEAGGNFRLPETRGEYMRGFDNGRGIDAGRVFGSYQLDQFQAFQTGSLADASGARTYYNIQLIRDTQGVTGPVANYSIVHGYTLGQGAANAIIPVDDGTNGAPRTGPDTHVRGFTARLLIRY